MPFRKFLRDIDRQLPFQTESRLGDAEKARAHHEACEGNVRILMKVLEDATDHALARGAPLLRKRDLCYGFDQNRDRQFNPKKRVPDYNPFHRLPEDE